MINTVVLENSIMQKGKPATAGSKMLENFISPIDAAVVTRLEAAGVEIVGRACMEEFGLTLTDKVNACEAVDFVADGKADLALCNDYTGAVSYVTKERGLYCIHPTYGTVSRYGLIPAVTSMDQIGIVCRSPEAGFYALKIIAGYDSKDGAMLPGDTPDKPLPPDQAPNLPPQIKKAELEPKHFEIHTQIMQILCCAELGNNISRYDGIKFGHRAKEYDGLQELYKKSRTEAFGLDIKLAAIIGAMVLSQENYTRYYDKAMRMRRQIKESLEFDKYDVIVTRCPTISRLCGLPSITTPEATYIADAGREDILEAVCKAAAEDDKTTRGDAYDI